MTVPSSVQLEVAVQQTLEGLAVAGLIAGHLMDGKSHRALPKSLLQQIKACFSLSNLMFHVQDDFEKVHRKSHRRAFKMAKSLHYTGVYQMDNGFWGYRYTITTDGKRKDVKKTKDTNGQHFKTSKAA